MAKIKVILQVGEVDEGETVTKPTGQVEYVVRDTLRISMNDARVQLITAEKGTRFLVSPTTTYISAVPHDQEVALVFDHKQSLLDWLQDELDAEASQ